MKKNNTQRTPQQQYGRLNKLHRASKKVCLCIMPPWCALMLVLSLLASRPLWLLIVALAITVCVVVSGIVYSVFSEKLRRLKKEIDGMQYTKE